MGAAETTLINLTSAYAPFVNGGKKTEPKLISRIQDRRGKTIFQQKVEIVTGCDKFINQAAEFPKINNNKNVISEENALPNDFNITRSSAKRNCKEIKIFKSSLSREDGTTNDNFDAWFIGFSSDLVIGVYIGYDNPKTLGKFETGSKASFYPFLKICTKALFKEDLKILKFLKIFT